MGNFNLATNPQLHVTTKIFTNLGHWKAVQKGIQLLYPMCLVVCRGLGGALLYWCALCLLVSGVG